MEMGNGPGEVHLSTVLKIYNDNQDLVQRLVRVSPMIYGNFIVNILPISQEIFDVTTIETKVLSIKLLLLVIIYIIIYNIPLNIGPK